MGGLCVSPYHTTLSATDHLTIVAAEAGDEQQIIHWVGKEPGSAGWGQQL